MPTKRRSPGSSTGRARSSTSTPLSPLLLAELIPVLQLFGWLVPNPLVLAAVRPTTWKKYLGALRDFHIFVVRRSLSIQTPDLVDTALADRVYELFLDQADLSAGSTLWAGWKAAFPDFGKAALYSLPLTARALSAWRRLRPAATRPPMPWLFLVLVAQVLVLMGLPVEALYFLVLFTAYLRPSEGLRLHVEDVAPPVPGTSIFVAINLHPEERQQASKTMAMNESILLDHPWHLFIADALLILCEKVGSGPVFNVSPAHLSECFRKAQEQARLPRLYVPYQLRHGGPSADMRDRMRTPLEIKQRGRWMSDLSMRRYEAAARLQREEGRAEQGLVQRAQCALCDLPDELTTSLRRLPARGNGPASSSRSLQGPNTSAGQPHSVVSKLVPLKSTMAKSKMFYEKKSSTQFSSSSRIDDASSYGSALPAPRGREPEEGVRVLRPSGTPTSSSTASQTWAKPTSRKST